MKLKKYLLALMIVCTPFQPALADLRIEVTKGVDNAVRVAVVPFDWRGAGTLPESISDIIEADLVLSGRFDSLPTSQMLSLPHETSEIFNRDWRLLNVEYLLIGHVSPVGDRYRLTYTLYNVFKQSVELRQTIEGSVSELRDMAHYASDSVFKILTGIDGAFSTQIM